MARSLRIEFPGAIYHVTCRMLGDWRTEHSRLFKDDADRNRFLNQLSERVEQYHIRLFLYVCMTNHFHLVFETPEANCSKFMQSLSTAYTVYYNLRHKRHGHLLDGRYKAKLVDGDNYLLALSRYVHLNPVQIETERDKPLGKRIATLRSYAWSSYPSYIGLQKAIDFIEYGPLLAQMSGKRHEWPQRYREFVERGLAKSDNDFNAMLKQSPRSIGSDSFRAWIDDLYQRQVESCTRIEDVSFRHITEPLSVDEVLATLAEVLNVDPGAFKRRLHGSPLRGVAAHFLIRYSRCSQRDIADVLCIGSGAAVGNQLHRLPEKLVQDDHLQQQVAKLEKRFQQRHKGEI
ncbi:MAG: transposase [Kiritimatiellia bacterium]|jgi:REP element-mobilizing transposase RayT|nr:transposase [Kiritimatiellia bacterium]